jgi:aminopeptidase C
MFLSSLRFGLDEFEFSQNYVFFCDKLEKSNYFLENILNTLNEDVGSRTIQHLLHAPVNDGGQWDMFVNIVNKVSIRWYWCGGLCGINKVWRDWITLFDFSMD